MHFGTGKIRDVLCRACRTARRDTLVTTSATGSTPTTRHRGRRHSVDWGGHVYLTFSRSCSWDWCQSRAQKTKLVHASTTASSLPTMLEQARHDTHGKRDIDDTSHHDTHDMRDRSSLRLDPRQRCWIWGLYSLNNWCLTVYTYCIVIGGTRGTRRACCVVTWRNKWNLG